MSDNQPYSNTFHPYKSLFDKLLYLLVFRPLNYIVKIPWNLENDSSDNNKILQHYMDTLRTRTSKMEGLVGILYKKKIRKYKKNVVFIPRNREFLFIYRLRQ